MNDIFLKKKDKKIIRIDKFIQKKLTKFSRNQIQKYIKLGKITVNNSVKKNNYKLKKFDSIIIKDIQNIKKEEDLKKITAEKINFNIIYEDNDILIINKPSGMVVHPGYGNKNGTLIHGIKYYLISNFHNLYRGGLIHRLDKNTSGLIIIAKNNFSQNFLIEQFSSRNINKEYLALVWGNLLNDRGTISGFIKRDPNNRIRMINHDKNFGKYSITTYKVLKRFKYLTYISCKPHTGRTHQIRVHFKYLGHPLFSDPLYNGKKIFFIKKISNKDKLLLKYCMQILQRQALHARYISFIHPRNHEKYSFLCPIPKDFNKVIQICKKNFL
ncbi:RluA family pseudouridine synthase [Blattabacterium cuenoti]|uniref:RluA family pseudouridine synthase n=1 Tax=Blattabacterium cuenoti TaxID=1653831 RepID=UPI00163D2C85|nr:RluA family pseudouridine synthase [Blattabacterium cuenoti]